MTVSGGHIRFRGNTAFAVAASALGVHVDWGSWLEPATAVVESADVAAFTQLLDEQGIKYHREGAGPCPQEEMIQ